MKIIVVGAGVIGALTAYRLAAAGADVVVVDAGAPAGAASGASFGWINASFYADAAHHRLRAEGIAAWHRVTNTLTTDAVQWQGCLCWEEQGQAFDDQAAALAALGYPVQVLDQAHFMALEPQVTAPDRALLFSAEGAVDLEVLAKDALDAACAAGGRVMSGFAMTGLETRAGRVTGMRWAGGVIACDRIVVAAGTVTAALASGAGVDLPMLDRPGLMLRSAPLPPILAHILVTPHGEVRQDPTGRVLAPTAVSHQGDTTERIDENPMVLAQRTADRLEKLLGRPVPWEGIRLAHRPVPRDGLPVMGFAGPEGLYLATMHSGATLGAIAAELITAEVLGAGLDARQTSLIAPYRPQRFKE